MSVPQDKLMELMRGSRSAGGGSPSGVNMPGAGMAPPPGAMSDAETPPMASPMSTPEPKMGSKEAAMINLGMAMDLLEQSLPAFGFRNGRRPKGSGCYPHFDWHSWPTQEQDKRTSAV